MDLAVVVLSGSPVEPWNVWPATVCLMRRARPVVGVDIDGVLGNQVEQVLRDTNARLGLALDYEHVVHWDMPLGDTSLVPAIREAMRDPRYVLEMPVHEGAAAMLAELSERYFVKIITVRPPEVMALTAGWLDANLLRYDELVPAEEALKSSHGADALVDDYPKNVVEYLANTAGVALLVDQPWNQDTTALTPWLDQPRLWRVHRLREVPALLATTLA